MVRTSARRRRRLGPFVAVPVLLVLAVIIWAVATLGPASDRIADAFPLKGKAAPLIEGDTIAGTKLRLGDYQGRWVLVNFMASWCNPCKKEHPELVEFAEAHDAKGDAAVISVAANDSEADARAFFAERGGNWPVLVDSDGTWATKYGMIKLPESYLVSPSGVVVAKFISVITAEAVDSLIAQFEDAARQASAATTVAS
ncbi:MAG: TlpA family protein disulfide reductase [Acidimicrobiia bacterium]